jgi:flagellar protein FliL
MPPPPKVDGPPPAGAAAAAAKADKPAPPPVAPQVVEAPTKGSAAAPRGMMAWLPAVMAIVVAPAATWATAEYILVPRLQKKLALPAMSELAAANPAAEPTKDGKPKEPATYRFENVVVNISGTMGTRYLKTSFYVVGDAKGTVDVKKIFEENHTKLYDTTLNVLSALTLADIDEAGSRNVIREKLVSAYNQALGRRVAEQVYFSDFVTQ